MKTKQVGFLRSKQNCCLLKESLEKLEILRDGWKKLLFVGYCGIGFYLVGFDVCCVFV